MKNKIGKNIENIMMGIILGVGVIGVIVAQVGHAKTMSVTKQVVRPHVMDDTSCPPSPTPNQE